MMLIKILKTEYLILFWLLMSTDDQEDNLAYQEWYEQAMQATEKKKRPKSIWKNISTRVWMKNKLKERLTKRPPGCLNVSFLTTIWHFCRLIFIRSMMTPIKNLWQNLMRNRRRYGHQQSLEKEWWLDIFSNSTTCSITMKLIRLKLETKMKRGTEDSDAYRLQYSLEKYDLPTWPTAVLPRNLAEMASQQVKVSPLLSVLRLVSCGSDW